MSGSAQFNRTGRLLGRLRYDLGVWLDVVWLLRLVVESKRGIPLCTTRDTGVTSAVNRPHGIDLRAPEGRKC